MTRTDAAFVIAVATLWVLLSGLVWGTHAVGGADAYGYVSQAALWLERDLVVEQPLAGQVPWPDADATLSPLGYRPGLRPGTIVPIYAAGLPIVMALLQWVFGGPAVFLVVPVLGAVAVLASAGLASRVSGPTGGAFAALLLGASPTLLFSVMWPMSDAAAAGWWALAIWGVTRTGVVSAGVAGAASALAVMTRPNLVGVAVAPFVYLVVRALGSNRRLWRQRLGLFSALTGAGCLAVAAIHGHLYGSPFVSGYGDLGWFFEVDRAPGNVAGFLLRPLAVEPALTVLAGAGAVAWLGRSSDVMARAAGWLCLGVVGLVWVSYLFFYTFPEWWYLRLLVPSYPALAVLGGAAVARVAGCASDRWRPALVGAIAAIIVFVGLWQSASREVYRSWEYESRYEAVGRFVAEELPPNAVFFAFHHSGSLRYYADRTTIRFDLLAPEWMEAAIVAVRDAGYHPYFVIEDPETTLFEGRFSETTPFGALDWPARAEFEGSVGVRVFDPADRQRQLSGEDVATQTIGRSS